MGPRPSAPWRTSAPGPIRIASFARAKKVAAKPVNAKCPVSGKKIDASNEIPVAPPEDAKTVGEYGSEAHPAIPGTIALVAVFFTSFVLYYFVNWKYLAEVWPLR